MFVFTRFNLLFLFYFVVFYFYQEEELQQAVEYEASLQDQLERAETILPVPTTAF